LSKTKTVKTNDHFSITEELNMKTITQSSPLNPTILLLGLMAAGVVLVAVTGKKVPLLSNSRVDLAILLVLGMAMCAQGGIGRVAALNAWSHPLSILGYILGIAILLTAVAVFIGLKLPFIQSDQAGLLIVAGLMVAKVLNSVIHSLLVSG
jgi:hypothetical protein